MGHAAGSHTITWPDRLRCEHLMALGKTGTGKTHFLEHLAVSLAEQDEGIAFIDFHGDVSRTLVSRLLKMQDGRSRIVVVDPSHPTRSPGINVLATDADEASRFRKVSELSSILRQRWGVDSFGARTEELLRNSLYTLALNGCPLTDLPRLLTDTTYRHELVQTIEQPEVLTYWRERYEPLSEAMQAVFREPLLNKVTGFLTEPAARHLLGQRQSTIDIADVMRRGQWLILRLPKGRLREHAHTLGNLLFAQLQFAVMGRDVLPAHQRRTFTIICDEVQNLAENDLEVLLTEGRKFGVSLVTANQHWQQLPTSLRGALLSTGSHACFRVSSTDAAVLGGELNLERKHRLSVELTRLDRGEAIATFGHGDVERFRVPGLAQVQPVGNTELDELITPVSTDRRIVEQQLRQHLEPLTPESPTTNPVEEGHHEW